MLENDSTAVESSKIAVPEMKFIEDVDEFMKLPSNDSAEIALKNLDEMLSKYRYLEEGLAQRKLKLKSQIPELEQSLELINVLEEKSKSQDALETTFLLSDQCYLRAAVPPTQTVGLWLGANVMLEYTLDEAKQLLRENLTAASNALANTAKDLDFLKDQITTSEVNMARVYNWDVQRRKHLTANS